MMHRVSSLGLAVAFVLAMGVAVAADKDKPVTKSDSTVVGTVAKVDTGLITVTVTDDKGKTSDQDVKVAKDAEVTLEGKKADLKDLTKGLHVTVTTKKDGDNRVATKIEAKKSAEKKDKDK
jgi:hypothetical protein